MAKHELFHFFRPTGSSERILRTLRERPASMWERKGEELAMDLFEFTNRTVPAYQTLLRERHINPRTIRTITDFKTLPLIDKGTYLRAHPYKTLLPDGYLSEATTIAATTGSTGEPFYFPRGEEQDAQYEFMADIFFRNQFGLDRKRASLGIIGFGCGIWIGGIFTYKTFNELARKKYNLALAPVGPNIELYLETLKKMAPMYDQVVLMGYPPFVKDVIDRSKEYGIDWKRHHVKILTAAEGYSEKFRDYVSKETNVKNIYTDTLNMYGTVELGTMAHETPLSILIRRVACEDKKIFESIFPKAHRLPTLAQYHPYQIYFEEVNGEVVATGMGSSIPLLRYRFPDAGGVISFENMLAKLKDGGRDVLAELKKMGLGKTVMRLPFVYVYERNDFAVKLHLRDIYPETIKDALIQKPISGLVTGKFTMATEYNNKQDQYLELNLELKKGKKMNERMKHLLHSNILRSFYLKTSGPGDPAAFVRRPNLVKTIFWPAGHPLYFKPGIKQRWVKAK